MRSIAWRCFLQLKELEKLETDSSVAEQKLLAVVRSKNPEAAPTELLGIFKVLHPFDLMARSRAYVRNLMHCRVSGMQCALQRTLDACIIP